MTLDKKIFKEEVASGVTMYIHPSYAVFDYLTAEGFIIKNDQQRLISQVNNEHDYFKIIMEQKTTRQKRKKTIIESTYTTLGRLQFNVNREEQKDYWDLYILGEKNIPRAKKLAINLNKEFNTNIHLRLYSLQVENETNKDVRPAIPIPK